MLDRAWRRRDPQWRQWLLVKRRPGRRIYMRGYRAEQPAYRARDAVRRRAGRARDRLRLHSPGEAAVTQER